MTPFKFTDAALSQHIAIVGKTGSGKTYTAKGLVETMLGNGRRVCILDPTGVWWGLKSTADGRHAGFPMAIFGGMHADVPIAEGSGEALAKIIATKNLPAIVDLSEMLIGQRHRFATDFAEALYRDNRTPLHLVIDEADEFMPQNPLPESKRMLHHFDRIVRRGRVRGFRVVLITQRPAVLHKNVLTQANALVALRLTAPQDRAALQAWVEGNADAAKAKEVIGSLAGLQRGHGWVWAPEAGIIQRATFPPITTFDSGRTPEDGDEIAEPTMLAAVDLAEVQASLEEVKPVEPDGEKQLRAELSKQRALVLSLEREVAALKTSAPTSTNTEALKNELALATRERDGLHLVLEGWHALARKTAQSFLERTGDVALGTRDPTKLAGAVARNEVREEAAQAQQRVTTEAPAPRERASIPAPAPRQREVKAAPAVVPSGLNGPQQRILDALAWWKAFGVQAPTRAQVAFVAQYSPQGGAFLRQVGTLRTSGYVDYPDGGCVCLTPTGLRAANEPGSHPTIAALHDAVRAILNGPQRKILQPLFVAYPNSLSREQVAAAAGYEPGGGAFLRPLGSLRTLGLVDYPRAGHVIVLDILFPKGKA